MVCLCVIMIRNCVFEQEHLIENEVAVLRRVRHPSIIELIEVDETPSQLFLVMELVKVPLLLTVSTSTGYGKLKFKAY